MKISEKINNYIFFEKDRKYTIKNFDYFSTEYQIDNTKELPELKDYTIMIDLVKKINIKKIVIDVGANCGLFSIPISLIGYKTFAFEPIKMNINILIQNKNENKCSQLEIINSALMDFNGYKNIYIPYCSDNTSFNEYVAVSNMNKKDFLIENVECITFDTWIKSNNIYNIGFIKIDVQGFEYNVIKGMEEFLTENNDVFILLEWDENHTKKAGFSLNEIYDFLISKGFEDVYSFANDKLFYKK